MDVEMSAYTDSMNENPRGRLELLGLNDLEYREGAPVGNRVRPMIYNDGRGDSYYATVERAISLPLLPVIEERILVSMEPHGNIGDEVTIVNQMTGKVAYTTTRTAHGWIWTIRTVRTSQSGKDVEERTYSTDRDGCGLFYHRSDGGVVQCQGSFQYSLPSAKSAARRAIAKRHRVGRWIAGWEVDPATGLKPDVILD